MPKSLTGSLNKLTYMLSRHYFWGWTLSRWFFVVFLALIALAWLNILPGGQALLIIIALLGLGFFALGWQGKRQGYLQFEVQRDFDIAQIESHPLTFDDKIQIQAAGIFRVGGQNRYFIEEPAYYQCFETRERVIMVAVSQRRFLYLFPSAEWETGWWYAFFTPQNLIQYEPGQLYFGRQSKPAIRLSYHYQDEEDEGTEILYFSFNSAAEQKRILADLAFDFDSRRPA